MPEAPAAAAHRGVRAIQRMVEFAPATGGLALWLHHRDLPAGAEAPVAATDGRTVFYGPAFAALPLPEQAGWVAHEVLHIALRHPQRFLALQARLGDADLALFNVCADAIVNSALGHLAWLRLPAGAATLDDLLSRVLGIREPVAKSLLEWDVERLYRTVDDRRGTGRDARRDARAQGDAPRQDGLRSAVVRTLGAPGHADLAPAADTQGPPEAEADEAREWSERILRAHAGDGPHSMLRALLADLPRTRTPWEQVLRTRLARGLARRPDVSWSRPARSWIANQGRGGPGRRMPWEPGCVASRAMPRLAVIADVSGSIDDALMERFAREVEAIARRTGSGLVLVVGDNAVQRVERFAPGRADLGGIAFRGGGGTDFTPLLEEADRHRPDIGVVLTDLEGPARFQPRWPVIWAVTEAHAANPEPFGRKLVLD